MGKIKWKNQADTDAEIKAHEAMSNHNLLKRIEKLEKDLELLKKVTK